MVQKTVKLNFNKKENCINLQANPSYRLYINLQPIQSLQMMQIIIKLNFNKKKKKKKKEEGRNSNILPNVGISFFLYVCHS